LANTKSAIKNVRKNEKRRAINKARTSALRTQLKKMRGLLEEKDSQAASKELVKTISAIDRSLRKGVLHKNTAARYKSRLTKSVRALGASKA
jgi:small subunit ribosomal protein S20